MAQEICIVHGTAYPEGGKCPACVAGSKVQNELPRGAQLGKAGAAQSTGTVRRIG